MPKFIDRESEMRTLTSEYNRDGSALVILYGRRRVGKTFLVEHFFGSDFAFRRIGRNIPEMIRQ